MVPHNRACSQALGDEAQAPSLLRCIGRCDHLPETQAVLGRIANVTQVPIENFENFQILRYLPGQYYRTHHDMSENDNRLASGPRIYTFFLYLSDVEEGGETNFPRLDLDVAPRKGSALLWPSVLEDQPTRQEPKTFHQAKPVIKGTKFAANSWIHMYNYREPNLWGCTGAFDAV